MRNIRFTQQLPVSLSEAWDFFSHPSNLEQITPDDMVFEVTSQVPDRVYEGLMITYKVSPLLRIKLDWCTEITHVRHEQFFVDEQRLGPFRIWHHEHHFEANEHGVLMTDILTYHVGWGFIGRIADAIMVRKKVLQIFEFRRRTLEKIFPIKG